MKKCILIGPKGQDYSVRYCANGVTTVGRTLAAGRVGGGRRGVVSGFSVQAERRMRHLMMALDYSSAVAVTLTHPTWGPDVMRGPEPSFTDLVRHTGRFAWMRCLLWRKEVTRAGMPHYHTILWASDGVDPAQAGEMLLSAWIDSCLVHFGGDDEKASVFRKMVRADMISAHHDRKKPAMRVMYATGYLRYMLDHQSKHKDYQARTTGRAWGVVRRENLPFDEAVKEIQLPERQWYALRRILRRISRYSITADCVFGWRHSRGRQASLHGKTDYFANRRDCKLGRVLVDWVINHVPPVAAVPLECTEEGE